MSTLRVANVHLNGAATALIDNPTGDVVRILAGGTEKIKIDQAGRANVSGDLNVTGTLQVNGASVGAVNVQTFNASGTWTKPSGFGASSRVLVEAWGGGGSGSKYINNGSGGGGGGYNSNWFTLSTLGSTESVTIGLGGAAVTTSSSNGNAGGTTSFGTKLYAYGGNPGSSNTGGGGGGQLAVSGTLASFLYLAGPPLFNLSDSQTGGSTYVGGGSYLQSANRVTAPGEGHFHGGGGAAHIYTGASSVYGGGGGGSYNTAGGTSSFGGAGGAGSTSGTATSGSQPGGGGGGTSTGTSGAGGDGRVIVTVFNG